MNTHVNMFTAKKVRLHGMTSAKWTTKDKISQYKGLINLYTRDRNIIEVDSTVGKKRTILEIKDMVKKIYTDRRELDNATRGDKQQLRNSLSEHKELQLAYQNSHPKKVIDAIDQLNFNQRKALDKLKYEKKLKSQKLIDLKLEAALLEDRIKYESLGEIKAEKEAKIITGHVQDAILRKEAAWSIHHIFKEILDIMKKDAMYFESIIDTVKSDGYAQSKCFLGATRLGQLATEYLDDRRQEYTSLEKIVLKDLAARKTDINVATEQVENAVVGMRQLIRRDSDITTGLAFIAKSPSLENLRKDLEEVEKTLNFLKSTTSVPNFEEQLNQRKRLKRLAKKFEIDRDYLQNKKNHAELMSNVLKTTVQDDIAEYKRRKSEMAATIEDLKEKKKACLKVLDTKRHLAACVKLKLTQLLHVSYNIREGKEDSDKEDKSRKVEMPEMETDGRKIVQIIMQKMPLLVNSHAKHKEQTQDVYKDFEGLMQSRMILAAPSKDLVTDAMDILFTEVQHVVLTREDIKRQSAEIVEANTKDDDLPVVEQPKKRKWKF